MYLSISSTRLCTSLYINSFKTIISVNSVSQIAQERVTKRILRTKTLTKNRNSLRRIYVIEALQVKYDVNILYYFIERSQIKAQGSFCYLCIIFNSTWAPLLFQAHCFIRFSMKDKNIIIFRCVNTKLHPHCQSCLQNEST